MPRSHVYVLALAALLAACEPTPTADLLEITWGVGTYAPPVSVDVLCSNGGCDGDDYLEVEVTFTADDLTPDTAFYDIKQYRVDYTLPDAPDEVPYFASVTAVTVDIDTTEAFVIRAAGDVQRDWVRAAYGVDQVDGIATISLAGNDHKGTAVIIEQEFGISFGDFTETSSQ